MKREIRAVSEITSISRDQKFIKAHMKDGTVYILSEWKFNETDNVLIGFGSHLGINRDVIIKRGSTKDKRIVATPFRVPVNDIALIETNDIGKSIGGGLAVVSGITAGFTIVCIIDPKACFGSCPTFYAFDGDTLALEAEGFSAAVTPSMEQDDIDMLYNAVASKDFELTVTNEALETHSIQYAKLLAFEKKQNERVFASPANTFYKCSSVAMPTSCTSESGSCLEKILRADKTEYFSLSDANDLNSKEEIFVDFDPIEGNPGLVIGKRQTLMTTFLMYQGLAYMGKSAVYWMAQHDLGKIEQRKDLFSYLGGIDVFSQNEDGSWKFEGSVNETGPIATDFNIVPLSTKAGEVVHIKLRMNKGLWRINYLALATIDEKVAPTVIDPYEATKVRGEENEPLQKLIQPSRYLVTYPGDIYKIRYKIPFDSAELFLDSRGYYLEWMRTEWIREQNFRKLNVMMNKPLVYLRRAASDFKKLESTMEQTFWNSRYVAK